jgi:hypothetical protein
MVPALLLGTLSSREEHSVALWCYHHLFRAILPAYLIALAKVLCLELIVPRYIPRMRSRGLLQRMSCLLIFRDSGMKLGCFSQIYQQGSLASQESSFSRMA